MEYKKIYDEVFNNNKEYNYHVYDKDRYDFVINEIFKNNYNDVIDISSGRGFLIKYLMEKNQNINITSTDLSKFNDLDINFVQLNLTEKSDYDKITNKYDFLSCMDVLEHIELKYIHDIFYFFKSISNNFAITVANHSDIFSGHELHLIQEDKLWWDNVFSKYFIIVDSWSGGWKGLLYSYILKNK